MNNQKAFTIVELLAAILILSIIIVGLISIFRYQSNVGADSWVKKGARDSIGRAMRMIADDLRHAGYGLTEKDEDGFDPLTLALYATGTVKEYPTGSSQFYYPELYISYGKYLGIGSYEDTKPVIFQHNAYIKGETQPTTTVELGTNIVFEPKYKGYVIGAFIGRAASTLAAQNPIMVNYCENDDPTSPTRAICNVSSNFSSNYRYAPAIKYSLNNGTIWRNFGAGQTSDNVDIAVPLLGKKTKSGSTEITIGNTFIIRDFLVRFSFYDDLHPTTPLWQPSSRSESGLNLTGTDQRTSVRNMKTVEIVVVYEVRDPTRTSKEGIVTDRSETIAPRAIAYTAAY